jgi:cytochrome c oxidase subunit 2
MITWLTSLMSNVAAHVADVDLLFVGLLIVSLLVLALLFALLFTFAIHYRAGNEKADRDHRIKRSWTWEVTWTTATLVGFLALFIWGASLYLEVYGSAAGAMPIYIVAKQWMWKAQHPGGQREINELHIPVNKPVRLVMASQDVIHSFFIPAFRVKHDVVPGRYQELRIEALRPGVYQLFCAEFCGTDHARMGGEIVALEARDYAAWLAREQPSSSLASEGAALFRSLGCSGCHGIGSSVRAPPLEGLYGKPVPLSDGTTTVADDRYLRDSILQPRREIAAGYEPLMPSFAGRVSEDQVFALVAYIKSLADRESLR